VICENVDRSHSIDTARDAWALTIATQIEKAFGACKTRGFALSSSAVRNRAAALAICDGTVR